MPIPLMSTVVFELSTGSTSVSYQLQQSGDLENWSNKASARTANTVGYHELNAVEDVNSSYVRVKFTVSNGKAVVSANLNVSNQ